MLSTVLKRNTMKPRLKSSPAARELIKRHEPFRETAERGPDGRWVVGYGHRAAARDGIKVSREDAGLLLIYDVMQAEQAIDEIAPEPLARGQRDALISFVHDIGAEAFHRSDVARYLYEGRLRAAGEAIAAYGDGAGERREAEAAHFLDALVPAPAGAVSRTQPVELVIKVEHPAEDRVLERAAAVPVEVYAPPPPPPPSARDITSRSEAEAEIARILAAVEAMPLDRNGDNGRDTDTFAPVETAVADLSDEPVAAEYRAVDAAAGTESCEPAVEPEAEPVAAASGRERETADSAEARVAARMSEELADRTTPVTDAEIAAAAFQPPHGMDLGFVMTQPAMAPGDPGAPPNETPEVPHDPIPEIEPDPAPGPEVEPNPEPQPNPQPIPEIEPDPTPGIEPEPGPDGPTAAAPKEYVLERGVGLGYALTSVLQGRFALPPETAPAASKPAAPAPDEAPAAAGQAETIAVAEARTGRPAEQAVTEIVERAVSAAVRDNPPPHPSERPAPATGAVGEVEGEHAVQAEPEPEGDLLMDGDDPLMERDEFTPQDLAADVHPVTEPPAPSAYDGGMAFLAALVSGAVAAGVGGLGVYGDWEHIWTERDLTLELIVLLGGSFVMIGAGWQLASIWLARLNEKSNA